MSYKVAGAKIYYNCVHVQGESQTAYIANGVKVRNMFSNNTEQYAHEEQNCTLWSQLSEILHRTVQSGLSIAFNFMLDLFLFLN